MKTLKFTPTNKNTRANARKLTTFLKSQGIKAVAPSKKDQSGEWTVKASVKRSKAFFAVNKGVALKTNLISF